MKIKKNYSFSNDRQIWRLLPNESGKLLIEDRDINTREVFFSCLEERSGKILFRNIQLEERFWIGIEAFDNDIIIFHKFRKPDLPGHKDLIVFDIRSQSVLWQSDEFNFHQIQGSKLFAFKQKFEGRDFYLVNLYTGEIEKELGTDPGVIPVLNNFDEDKYKNYYFPIGFYATDENPGIKEIIKFATNDSEISGTVEYIIFHDLLFMNFYEKNQNSKLTNKFYCIQISSGKTVLNEVLNKDSNAFVPDSFYIKDENLYLLKNKNTLIVYKIL